MFFKFSPLVCPTRPHLWSVTKSYWNVKRLMRQCNVDGRKMAAIWPIRNTLKFQTMEPFDKSPLTHVLYPMIPCSGKRAHSISLEFYFSACSIFYLQSTLQLRDYSFFVISTKCLLIRVVYLRIDKNHS